MDTNSANTSGSVYETLKEELLNLTIKPGETLSENEVCARFCVSRTPVRTAFQRLKDEGLLTIEPYKSTYASLLDFDNIQQLIYLRVAVETAVLRDLIEQVDPMTIEKIRYNLRRQAVLLSGSFTPENFYEIDSRLHEIWFRYLKKEILWQTIQRAQVNYTRFRMLDIVEAQRFDVIYREHLELFEAIVSKDIPRMEKIIRVHLYGGINRLENRIEKEFADYFVQPVKSGKERG